MNSLDVGYFEAKRSIFFCWEKILREFLGLGQEARNKMVVTLKDDILKSGKYIKQILRDKSGCT